jgi:hypothetical protein
MLTGCFVPGPDAACAQIKPNRNPIYVECGSLNIGKPGSTGMLFGMAYPVSKTKRFFTNITFDSQF